MRRFRSYLHALGCGSTALILVFGCGSPTDASHEPTPDVSEVASSPGTLFAGCSQDPVVVDTLDFALPDDPGKVIYANVFDKKTGTTYFDPLSQPVIGNSVFRIKFDDSARYEYYTWDDEYLYLRYDHTWGEGPGGATSYEFTEVPGKGGRWMKRSMQVGESISVQAPAPAQRNFHENCAEQGVFPLHYRNTLRYHCPSYDLGDLGSDEVIVLEYRYGDDSGYELFFFSRVWGWVRWMQFRRSGTTYYEDGDVFRRGVRMCGTSPCQALQPEPFCVGLPGPQSGAAFVSQSLPSAVAPGQAFQASFAFRNTGTTTWTAAEGYRLGSMQELQWGQGRVDLPAGTHVAPGATHTFEVTLTAPGTPGEFDLQWRMVHEHIEWFGATSPLVRMTIGGSGGTGGAAGAGGGSAPEPMIPTDSLYRGETLLAGDARTSQDGRFSLVYQHDGNLVLVELASGQPLWATDTGGTGAGVTAMQSDGNLVVYDGSGVARWASYTGPGATHLVVQNDGNLVIRDTAGTPLWSSGTGGH